MSAPSAAGIAAREAPLETPDLAVLDARSGMAPHTPTQRIALLSRTVAPEGARGLCAPRAAAVDAAAAPYEPKRVLFTGGAGFIGSNTMVHLVKTYPDVLYVCFDCLADGSNIANLKPVEAAKNFRFVKGNLCDEAAVHAAMTEHEIDTVMHFAAETHVDRSFSRPVHFAEANVVGTAVLLKVSQKLGVRRFLHVSTDEVYGENLEGVFDEDAALMPGNPYSASKAACECLVRGYLSSFSLPVVMVRPNNIYGPRQFPEKMIPKFIFRLARKDKLPLHGGGNTRRSFLFVQDAAEAFDLILRRGVIGDVYNIGARSDSTRSVIEVAKALMPHFGIKPEQFESRLEVVRDRLKNDSSYDVDSKKLQALGWQPKVNFPDGLKITVDWYMAHLDHWGSVENALKAHNAGEEERR